MKYIHPNGQWQDLRQVDLLEIAPAIAADIVYSDPPWNPGNEKYWRTHAGVNAPVRFHNFLAAWCLTVRRSGASHVFVEQSANEKHRRLLLEAVEECNGWCLPLRQVFRVYYDSPPRANALLYFGSADLRTDPSGMKGDPMVETALRGVVPADLTKRVRHTIFDPCVGLGATSRVAHLLGCHCVGMELNPRRLGRTVVWLEKRGYAPAQIPTLACRRVFAKQGS